jgi:PAP2 superfamily
VWLASVLAGSMLGFVLVYRLTVLTVPGRLLGEAALRGADLGSSRAAAQVTVVLDVVTVTSMIAAVALVAVIALIRMRRALGLAAIGLLVTASVLSRILKSYVLTRPDLGLAESTPSDLNSLPSGHSTAAFSIGVALLFVVPVALRPATAVAGVIFSSAVAIATMTAGWHRAADSSASFLLVLSIAAVTGIIVLAVEQPPDAREQLSGAEAGPRDARTAPAPAPARSRTGLWLGLLAGALLPLAGLLIVALVAIRPLRESAAGPPIAFLAAGLLLIGSAAATTVLVLRIVERVAPAPVRPSMPLAPTGAARGEADGHV